MRSILVVLEEKFCTIHLFFLHSMASADFIVGIIGNIISVLLCASPVGAFWGMMMKKSAEDYNAVPYKAQLLCETLWTFYGIHDPNGLLISTVNSVGVLSQSIYVLIYLIYAPKDKKIKALVFVAFVNICFPVIVIATDLLVFHGDIRETFIGVLCAAVLVAMHAASLSVMRTVIKTESAQYVPFSSLFSCCSMPGLGLLLLLILKDPFVILLNAIGIMSGTVQIILCIMYKNKSSAVKSVDATKEEESAHSVKEGIKTQELSKKYDSRSRSLSGNLQKQPVSGANSSLRNHLRTVSFGDSQSGLLSVP